MAYRYRTGTSLGRNQFGVLTMKMRSQRIQERGMFLAVAFLLSGVACSDEPDDGSCYFDGRYELGYIARTPDCRGSSVSINFYDETDECSSEIDQLSNAGARQRGFVTCNPDGNGGQVVECDGYMSDSDGCEFDIYMRRVAS